jgi:uncharacterized LabA/DUF88 family protein
MTAMQNIRDIAVFWDYQNLGFKKGSSFAQDILEFLKKRGRVVAAYAYSDWKRSSEEAASVLFQNRYELIHVPNPTKNTADVLMTAHAMAHLADAPNIDEYVLVSKDYDFRPLIANLQRKGKRVVLICKPVDTRPDLLGMVDDFIDLQEIRTEAAEAITEETIEADEATPDDVDVQKKSAFAQLQETVREIELRGNKAGIGYTKIIMTSLNPGFDETEINFQKWGDFVGAAEREGFITLDGEGAATIIGLPKKMSSAAKESIDLVQKGFEFLVRTVKKMKEEGKSTEQVLVASLIHSINPAFNPANLGFRRFSDFVKAAEQRGLVELEMVPGKQPIIQIPSIS